MLLSVRYSIACHTITVTNYNFTWCSVVMNVMFNTVKSLSFLKGPLKINDECRKMIDAGKLFVSNYLRRIV
jgi:hypothetical protein